MPPLDQSLEVIATHFQPVYEAGSQAYETVGAGGFFLGVAAIAIVGEIALPATAHNFSRRRNKREELRPLYEQGLISTRPTIFNAYRLEKEAFPRQLQLFSE